MEIVRKHWFVILIGLVIAFVIGYGLFNGNSDNSQNQTSQDNSSTTTPVTPTDTDHISSYVSAFTNSLHSLYVSTQELDAVSKKYPTTEQSINVMTASLQIDSDFTDATTFLQPYINDKNPSIQTSAQLLYYDILLAKKANQAMIDILRTATPETFNLQQSQYTVSQYASAQNTIQKDLFQNKILFVITKGLIQLPVETNDATGLIKYSISPTQRQDLLGNIKTTFGTTLNNYNNNVYLLAVKLIQMSLTFDTYEEQKNFKLN